eukprot:11162100-Lingulodinium_polyedra.AAC.1
MQSASPPTSRRPGVIDPPVTWPVPRAMPLPAGFCERLRLGRPRLFGPGDSRWLTLTLSMLGS